MDLNKQPPLGLQYPERLDPYTRAELEQLIAAFNRRLHNVVESIPSGVVVAPQPVFFGISGRDGQRGRDGAPGTIGVNGTIGRDGAPGIGIPGRDAKESHWVAMPGSQGPVGAAGANGTNGTGLTQLSQIVTSGAQTTVDFTSISGSYSSLLVVWIAQNSGAGSSDVNMHLKINNDGTSGNYSSAGRTGVLNGAAINANVAATASGGCIATLAQSGTTGSASAGSFEIPGYAQTTFNKEVVGKYGERTTTAGIFTATMSFNWVSTAAITRLTLAASDATAFTNGSIFTLYGLT